MFPGSLKVLIVDGNTLDRDTHCHLSSTFCTVLEATSSDALEVCRNQSIDVVVFDSLQFTLLEEIRSTLRSRCPAVLVIAECRDESILEEILIKDQLTSEVLCKAIENVHLKRKLAQVQQKLKESEQFNKHLTEAFPYILYIFDLVENRNVYINRQITELLGYTAEQVQEMDCDVLIKLIHPEDCDRVSLHLTQFQTADDFQVFELEYRMRTAEGNWCWLHSQEVVFRRSTNGIADQILGIAQDITQRKRAVHEQERLFIEVEAARDQAETANRRKDEFLAVVSHELRSPLNSVLGWVRLLQIRTYDAATIKRALTTIERNALSQSQLIEDLLDISRMIRGNLRITLAPVNLPEIVEIAIANIQLAADAKEITVRSQIERSIGVTIGDPQRLQQILTNLLTNAVKFTPNGGNVQVILGTAADDGTIVEMIVRDTGKGIEPEFLPHIFNQFSQAEKDSNRTKDGLGLGLAIVHHLVELHHGTIRADSLGRDRGATFTVRLPLIQP